MNLNYSILWFDDDKDFFDSIDLDSIKEEILSWGFYPKIVPVFDADEFNSKKPYKEYDLIVVDFRLEGMPKGDEFIARVRDQEVYAEIILYSANPASDLWKSIMERKLDGIFVTNKNGIPQKIRRVFLQSVRKVLDLENMRGIVMSEVSDLDVLLESIFSDAMNSIPVNKKDVIFKDFHKNALKQVDRSKNALSTFKTEPSIEALLKLCDSDKRWQNFKRVKKCHTLLKERKIGDYSEEILWPRNCLAHGTPDRQDDGTCVFTFRGRCFRLTEDSGKSLRHKILEYKEEFQEIAKLLQKQ